MKPDIKKSLQNLAEKLPVQWTPVGVEKHPISAEDLYLCNQPVVEGYNYTISVPVNHKVNHFERLRRVFQKHGIEGVKKYVQTQI